MTLNTSRSVSNAPWPFREIPPRGVGTAGFEPATTRPPAECATRLRHVPTRLIYGLNNIRRTPCYHRGAWRARPLTSGPTLRASSPEQSSSGGASRGIRRRKRLRAGRHLRGSRSQGQPLYHRPGLKAAINNIKELEEWEVLVVAHPRCVSDTDSALHEFVHKFSLYGNRLGEPLRSWEGPSHYEGLPARDEPALSAGSDPEHKRQGLLNGALVR